ncbi:hypothetical protein ACFL43_02430 [Thermodesulfobacteriota bacterium]
MKRLLHTRRLVRRVFALLPWPGFAVLERFILAADEEYSVDIDPARPAAVKLQNANGPGLFPDRSRFACKMYACEQEIGFSPEDSQVLRCLQERVILPEGIDRLWFKCTQGKVAVRISQETA